MQIKAASLSDCLAIAELAQLAGHNIPGHFWQDARAPGESLIEAGARKVAGETDNFSYRNADLAWVDDEIAGMLLAYPLPAADDNDEDPSDFPDFVVPLVELEQLVPESYYINMIATYARFRGQGIATALIDRIDARARDAGCTLSSLEVFGSNENAIRLYNSLGFEVVAQRDMVESPYLPADTILLMTRPVR